MQTTPTEPGLYPAMPNEVYHALDGISKSKLDDIAAKSALHYWDKHINPDRPVPDRTEAMILGDAIHTAILEPDTLTDRVITVPTDAPRRPTSAQRDAKKPSPASIEAIAYWDAFALRGAGKIVLDRDDYDTIIKCRDAVLMHPVAGPLFCDGLAEQSYFAIDEETGELIKCRPDYYTPPRALITDLKTTEDAAEDPFGRSSATYRYDVQAIWYPDVMVKATGEVVEHFAFVCVEKVRPFAVGIYYFDENITNGVLARAYARRDLNRIHDCKQSGQWPDYGMTPKPLRLPGWARRVEQVQGEK